MATTRSEFHSVNDPALYVALELGKKEWKLGLTSGFGIAAWVRSVRSGDFAAMDRVVAQARRRFGISARACVSSCYEAGRDGFWIHRAVDGARMAQPGGRFGEHRSEPAGAPDQQDGSDGCAEAGDDAGAGLGGRAVWREVRVPSEAAEAARQVSRERSALVEDQTRLRNQIGSWLATCGCRVSARARARTGWWTTARDWQGAPLSAPVQGRLARAHARLLVVAEQIETLTTEQRAAVAAAPAESALGRLVRVKGVATTSASTLLDEGLIWRDFQNRREVGGLLGLAPAHPARSRDQSGRQCALASGEHSAGVELGALATE